ncbi:MAG: type III pantothenate kinase [Planctomycetes bacterium]|nr:type III pantothenate kinase [Planctomycetota bacterium]
MTAFIAIALGNSRAAAARADSSALGPVRRAPADRLEDLRDVLARACPDCGGDPMPVVVASVNPPALARLERLLSEMSLPPPEVARRDFPIPIRTDVREPERVGTDRLLGALAAFRREGRACIVVDCGTGITVNSVSAGGVFLGGAILPGLAMMARALAGGTALLPEVALPEIAPGIGRTSEEAIAAGILHGTGGAVATLVLLAGKLLGGNAAVLLTGGDAPRLARFLPPDCGKVFPDLVLEGLAIAYRERPARQPPPRK